MDIPIVYYPLTILCIDDEELMLRTLKNYISPKFPVITVNSPNSALEILNENSLLILNNYLKDIIDEAESDSSDIQLNIKLEKLIGLVEITNRTDEIGIIVVDYKLPEMTGIEFCQKIKHIPTFKILLTEYHDFQKVLTAFTDNTIHSFYPKSENELLTKLLQCIYKLTSSYFLAVTQQLKANIEVKNKLPISDSLFKIFFSNIIRDMEIREWFLLDINGSLLLKNSRQEYLYFVIHTEDSLNKFTGLYNESDLQVFIEPIIKRQKIPFFLNIDPAEINVSDWGQYLLKPQKFIGEKIYYWNIFKKEI